MYCAAADGLERRSAQTALFLILDAMTRMFAPILAFTCDEIWLAMPHRSSDDARNVLFNEMVQPYADYALSEDEMAKLGRIAAQRGQRQPAPRAVPPLRRRGEELPRLGVTNAKKMSAARQTSFLQIRVKSEP